jgi:hypothetical protein
MSSPRWTPDRRLGGLRRFAIAISVLNLFGHTVLGFEQAWVVPFVALAVTYGMDLTIESLEAWAAGRRPRFAGGWSALVTFLLPAHISGLAVGMLLYTAGHFWVVAFAAAFAMASKAMLRAPVGVAESGRPRPSRHFMNPSNVAVSATLLLFPWVSPAPPYQFVANVTGAWDFGLPLLVFVTGSLLNTRFTGRMPLVIAWALGFVAQALVRSSLNGTPLAASLAPMTGLGFVLYSFYMVTDPATTPERPLCQVAFGAGVAALYGLTVQSHHVFGIYYALSMASMVRGAWLHYAAWSTAPAAGAMRPAPVGTVGGVS